MRSIWSNSERLSHLATILTALVAVGALVVAIFQIQAANRTQREATAQETYREYLKLAIEQPALADGITLKDPKPEEEAKYGWFISYFLHSAEHIYSLFPHDVEWGKALASQVCIHRTYLSAAEFQSKYKAHYAEEFQKFIDRSLQSCDK